MKKLVLSLVLVCWTVATSYAQSVDRATPDEAKAFATKAAAYLKEVGPEKAFAAFSAKDGPWHDRDLYVIVQDNDVNVLAHGTNPGFIGKNMTNLRDVDGKPFVREISAVKTTDWIDYKWQNPVTKAVEPKTSYVVRVGDYVVVVGAYKKL
jgi:hypothetical protein